jgi:hypothetical protein
MLRPSTRRSFYVTVFREAGDPHAWAWEIRRKRRPLGVRLQEGGFRSYQAAQIAGRRALKDFLNGLAMDVPSQVLASSTNGSTQTRPPPAHPL